MKAKVKNEFPPGWNEKKVREVIAYYDQQTDEEGAAEIASAPVSDAWLYVPAELVGDVVRLIEDHEKKKKKSSKKGPKKPKTKRAP